MSTTTSTVTVRVCNRSSTWVVQLIHRYRYRLICPYSLKKGMMARSHVQVPKYLDRVVSWPLAVEDSEIVTPVMVKFTSVHSSSHSGNICIWLGICTRLLCFFKASHFSANIVRLSRRDFHPNPGPGEARRVQIWFKEAWKLSKFWLGILVNIMIQENPWPAICRIE